MFITPTCPSGAFEKLQFKSGYVLHSDFQNNQGCAKLLLSRPASLRSLSSPQLPLSPSPDLSAQKEIKGPQILCFHVVLLSPQEALIGTQQQRERLRGFTNELPNSIQVPGLTMKLGCRVLLGRCSLTVFPFFENTHASSAISPILLLPLCGVLLFPRSSQLASYAPQLGAGMCMGLGPLLS